MELLCNQTVEVLDAPYGALDNDRIRVRFIFEDDDISDNNFGNRIDTFTDILDEKNPNNYDKFNTLTHYQIRLLHLKKDI